MARRIAEVVAEDGPLRAALVEKCQAVGGLAVQGTDVEVVDEDGDVWCRGVSC